MKCQINVYNKAKFKQARPVTSWDKLIIPIYKRMHCCSLSSSLEYFLEDENGILTRHCVSNDKKAWKLIKKINDKWKNVYRYVFTETEENDWTIEKEPIEQTEMFSCRSYLK